MLLRVSPGQTEDFLGYCLLRVKRLIKILVISNIKTLEQSALGTVLLVFISQLFFIVSHVGLAID